jgi:hypothetical protein
MLPATRTAAGMGTPTPQGLSGTGCRAVTWLYCLHSITSKSYAQAWAFGLDFTPGTVLGGHLQARLC